MPELRRVLAWLALGGVSALAAGRAHGDPLRASEPPDAARACSSTAPCGDGEWCDHDPGLCGDGPRPGVCRPRPRACEASATPVCGCDGHRYASACEAERAGVDLRVTGGCGEAPRLIACGSNYCDPRESYCELVLSDVAELPTDRTCVPLPTRCRGAAGASLPCSCFPEGTRCASFCGTVDTGDVAGFRLTCRR